MKSTFRIIAMSALFFGVHAAFTQQKPAETAAKAPAITDALKAKFFKEQAQNLQAKASFDRAQRNLQDSTTAFQGAIQELVKACGDKFQPQIGADGDLACVVKPEAPKPAK